MHVAVRDWGPGLTPESSEHLFDAFYTTKPSGMGMGLSICRSIIEAHGGRMWATANIPQGAAFQFTLPIPNEPKLRIPTKPAMRSNLKPATCSAAKPAGIPLVKRRV